MHAAEIELKFAVNDVDRFRSRVQSLGLQARDPADVRGEHTLRHTRARPPRTPAGAAARDYAGRSVVTHKRVASNDADARYKVRIETESVIEDAAALAEIFTQLGYKPVFRYEKYRTEWDAGAGHVFLDETPIGTYAELEGPPEWIESMREQLGVKPEQCTTESYGMMFLDWKGRTHSPAENLTFDEIPAAVSA